MSSLCDYRTSGASASAERYDLYQRVEATAGLAGADALVARAIARIVKRGRSSETSQRASLAGKANGKEGRAFHQATRDGLQVLDFMRVDPVTIDFQLTIDAAAQLFVKFELSEAPVVDSHNIYRGMLTRADLLCSVMHADSRHLRVTKAARQNIRPVRIETRIHRLPQRFLHDDVEQLPVVSQRCLVGVILLCDLLPFTHFVDDYESVEDAG